MMGVIRTKKKKVKAEIFDCPNIRKLIQANGFASPKTIFEQGMWVASEAVLKNFFGKGKSKNRIVGEMSFSF